MSERWIEVLREECDRTSQREVSCRLGYSQSAIKQALKGKCFGNIDRLRGKVEGAYMGLTVLCPIIGEIRRDICIEHQGRPLVATNPFRASLHRACKTCPNRQPIP